MKFILHRCGDRYLLQSSQTGAYLGLILQGFPEESARAFSYDFGQVFFPQDLVNFAQFPELAQMPFFAIDYTNIDPYLLGKLEQKKDQKVLNLLKGEAKIHGYHYNRNQVEIAKLNVLWEYTPPNPKGIWKVPIRSLTINEDSCWFGNRDGLILGLNDEGEIINQYQLTNLISSFLGKENYFYASCDDGQIYDLNGKIPQAVFHLRPNTYYSDLNIFNLTWAKNNIIMTDTYGQLKLLDAQFKTIWENNQDQLWRSWFLAYQNEKIYVGHSKGVNCYEINKGKLLWQKTMKTSILWGELFNKYIIVGTSGGQIYQINQEGDWKIKTAKSKKIAQCQSASYSGIILPEQKLIITSDAQGHLYNFNFQGQLKWQKSIATGAILNLKAWHHLILAVTTEGTIFAFDLPTSS